MFRSKQWVGKKATGTDKLASQLDWIVRQSSRFDEGRKVERNMFYSEYEHIFSSLHSWNLDKLSEQTS